MVPQVSAVEWLINFIKAIFMEEDITSYQLPESSSVAQTLWDAIYNNLTVPYLQRGPSALFPDAWNYIANNIMPWVTSAGTFLISVFVLIGFIRQAVNLREQLSFEAVVELLLKLVLSAVLVGYSFDMMQTFISLASSLTARVLGSSRIIIEAGIPEGAGFFDVVGGNIIRSLMGLFFVVATIWSAFTIAIEVFLRYFDVLRMMCIGPIALPTVGGGPGFNNVAAAWVKAFLVSVFDLVMIALTLRLGSLFITSIADVSAFPAPWLVPVANIILIMTISGAVKSADRTLQRALGL